jgi:hypothetical protein
MTLFHVGQRVVCITEGLHWRISFERRPAKGQILTVRAIEDCSSPENHPQSLFFEEIVNEPGNYMYFGRVVFGEPSFCGHRFRPIVTPKTSIEIFERLLNPANHDRTVDA